MFLLSPVKCLHVLQSAVLFWISVVRRFYHSYVIVVKKSSSLNFLRQKGVLKLADWLIMYTCQTPMCEGHKGGVLFTVHEENEGPFTVHEENKCPITVHEDNKHIYATHVVNSWNMCMTVHIIAIYISHISTFIQINFVLRGIAK